MACGRNAYNVAGTPEVLLLFSFCYWPFDKSSGYWHCVFGQTSPRTSKCCDTSSPCFSVKGVESSVSVLCAKPAW
jgi:hypothetical protein